MNILLCNKYIVFLSVLRRREKEDALPGAPQGKSQGSTHTVGTAIGTAIQAELLTLLTCCIL